MSAEFITRRQTERAEAMLDELCEVESGLSEWEIRFIQDLLDWDGRLTVDQFKKLEEVYGRHC